MANKVQILDKISRNCQQLGLTTERGAAAEVIVEGMTVSYEDADIAKPEGGVDGSVSPFLGIGVASPGKIKIDLADVLATLADEKKLKVLRVCSGMANNIKIVNGATQLAELPGQPDMLMMGE